MLLAFSPVPSFGFQEEAVKHRKRNDAQSIDAIRPVWLNVFADGIIAFLIQRPHQYSFWWTSLKAFGSLFNGPSGGLVYLLFDLLLMFSLVFCIISSLMTLSSLRKYHQSSINSALKAVSDDLGSGGWIAWK
jgi:hypothetical protein